MNSSDLRTVALAGLTIAVLAAGPALAQGRGCGGTCCGDYDTESVVSIQGTVERVEEHTRGKGWKGTHLILVSGEETLEVHLGPSFFLEENDFAFSPGDLIEVTGSRGTGDKKLDLIAREVRMKERTLILRNPDGKPKWSRSPGSS